MPLLNEEPPKKGIDPATGALVVQGAIATAQAIAKGGPRRQYKWNKRAANDANQMNRDNAIWALEQNKRLQQEQRVYDSPAAQMARYKEAGLNPHLIYGSGAGSSGGTFPVSTQGLAPSRIDAPEASYPDIAGGFLSAGQTLATTALQEQRAQESQANTALKSVQLDIAKTNPMLSPGVAEWVATSMMESARLKSLESRSWMANMPGSPGYVKITAKVNAELEALTQKLGLNTADLKIKNKILESKEFENEVKKIQAEWLKDGAVTPEHMRQAMMLLLQKMTGK